MRGEGGVGVAGVPEPGGKEGEEAALPPPLSPPPPALEQSQPRSGSLLADPSGSKSEKSSFQTQLDVPRWPLSTNIAIWMRLFNQAQSHKKQAPLTFGVAHQQ